MKKYLLLLFLIVSYYIHAQTISTISPDGNIKTSVTVAATGELSYTVTYKNKPVILASSMSLKFKEPVADLVRFEHIKTDSSDFDETWKTVWGEYSSIRDHHKELKLYLKEKTSGILLNVIFRMFNEGVGFRYEFPQQSTLTHFVLADENTQFHLAGDHKTFWIPGDYDTNEFTYYTTKLSEVDAGTSKASQEIHAKTFFDKNAVQTPLMMKTADGLYINIHEAALINYPAMNLVLDKSSFTFNSHLVPDAVGNKAYLIAPVKTPWRTIIVSDKATDIIAANRMILNLNEPSKITDPSFITPQKYVGIWWEMHVGKSSWDYAGGQVGSQQQSRVPHGANTANTKRYIDFAAKHGFKGVLVEGWNTGWEDWFGKWKEDVFDFVTPYPDYDVNELSRYAASKGVKIIMHHETSGSATNYERWMDTAYRFMLRHGMNAVKSGYVGRIIPRGEHHDGQWMIKHYERAAKKSGDYKISINMHESVRLTGLHRTYPNWIASEAARGNEFNAWSSGNPPEHETILPFTRLMGGPMDYTPGIFQIKMNVYDSAKKEQVHTTLAKQLALYITMYSPLQMAADLPENYEKHLNAFQFIKDVAVDWDDTKILSAEPGDFLTIARKEKASPNWFIGAITDENPRITTAPLSFLENDKNYVAIIYRDAANAHWQNNPMAYTVEKFIVSNSTVLNLKLAAGGGAAISLMPADASQLKALKKYKN
ncbi:MAG TPA: glycoside hydrolase family 97 protein [Chitinophagaceae bacterium]|nr:glycoside hydrolase family 97 protein [Chitinophagaceae bacterium]